jgi:AraC-like DNA-binding protein
MSRFAKRLPAATGTSPAQFRSLRRIEAAKSLLARHDMTHEAIARSLGFATPRIWRVASKSSLARHRAVFAATPRICQRIKRVLLGLWNEHTCLVGRQGVL